jgi:hypothetical protein
VWDAARPETIPPRRRKTERRSPLDPSASTVTTGSSIVAVTRPPDAMLFLAVDPDAGTEAEDEASDAPWADAA